MAEVLWVITVYLHGFLKDKFGKSFELDILSPAEAVRALSCLLPGFEETIKAGDWHVLRGPLSDQNDDNEESLTLQFGEAKEMHLIPAIEGAQNGIFQTIAGLVMIVAGAMMGFADGGYLMLAGASMLVGGIVAMTTKMPSSEESVAADERQSFLFSKPTNSSSQGGAIPRGYGRMRVGSVVVSAAVVAEQLREEETSWELALRGSY